MPGHPRPLLLEGFARGRTHAPESRRIVRHLLSGCSECAAAVSEMENATRVAPAPLENTLRDPGAAYRLPRKRAAVERSEAVELFERLEAQPVESRAAMVRDEESFQTWGLCDLLLERSYALRFDDARRGVELSSLAVAISDLLEPGQYGADLVNDFRGRARAYSGNALRISSDHRAAGQCLAEAGRLLQDGSGDILEEACLLKFEAALCSDEGRYAEAVRLVQKAIRAYRAAGESELQNHATLSLAAYLGFEGRHERAIATLRFLLGRLDWEREPRMVLACRHNLIAALVAVDDLDAAKVLLEETRPLYDEIAEALSLLRLCWLEGQIAMKLGQAEEAEAAFRASYRGFVERGVPFDAALVCLELTAQLLEARRWPEAEALAAQLCGLFEALGTQREALAALVALRAAAEQRTLTTSLLRELASYLEQAKLDPSLVFSPDPAL